MSAQTGGKDPKEPSAKHSFSIHIKTTDNEIGEIGTTSLSDVLKSNTTLTELDLSGEDKRNNTQMSSVNDTLFHSHQFIREQHW